MINNDHYCLMLEFSSKSNYYAMNFPVKAIFTNIFIQGYVIVIVYHIAAYGKKAYQS